MALYIGFDMVTDAKQRGILKKALRKHFNEGMPCEVFPLTESARVRYDDDTSCGCYWTEYGYIDGRGLTDDDLREIFDSWRVRVYSPWDCSGEPFTVCIEWHRNPSGLISYRHRMGIDM